MKKRIIYNIAGILTILFLLGIILAFMTTNISWFLFSLIVGIIARILVGD